MQQDSVQIPPLLEDASGAQEARQAFAEVLSVNPHPTPQQLGAWRRARDRFDAPGSRPVDADAGALESRWRVRWLRADVSVPALAADLEDLRAVDADRAAALRPMLELRPEWDAMLASGLYSDDALDILRSWFRTGDIDGAWREFRVLVLARTYAERTQQFFPQTYAYGERLFRALLDKGYAREIAPTRVYGALRGGNRMSVFVPLLLVGALAAGVGIAIDAVPEDELPEDGRLPELEMPSTAPPGRTSSPEAAELMEEINRRMAESDGSPEAEAQIEALLEELRRLDAGTPAGGDGR